ncbi:MAG: DUF3108 domain-containing protein [Burkholderiales bacterium]
MPNAPPANKMPYLSWRLVLLTAVVLLAHWVVLRAAPLSLAAHESLDPVEASWAFSTRTIAMEAPATQAARTIQGRATPPPRARIAAQPSPASTEALTENFSSNHNPSPEEHGEVAITDLADFAAPETPASDAVVLLADARTATGKAAEAESDGTPVPSTKSLPAKAVRSFVIPPPARLKYDIKGEVKGFPYHVNGDLRWVQDGKTYDARMEISHFLLGSRVQTSTGQLTNFGLEPTRFGDKVRSEVAAHFDYEKNKITFSANTPDVPLLRGAQDQLSVLVQLAAMFGADPKGFPQGSTLPFQAVGPRSAESWVFTVGTTEKLQMPGGDINAIRLWRDPNGEYDAKTEIWLAPDVGFLPVRIRLTQPNGDFVDQQWRETLK